MDAALSALRSGAPASGLRDSIVALGHAAVPELVAMFEDEELSLEDHPEGNWPPSGVSLVIKPATSKACRGGLRRLRDVDSS